MADPLEYQTGFGNSFESEVKKGALPIGRNNPREVPFGLYCEQLSGTAFTRPRHVNQRTWIYRQQPSVIHNACPFQSTGTFFGNEDPLSGILDPNPLRWNPLDDAHSVNEDFISGMHLLASSGDPATRSGLGIYTYNFYKPMKDYFYSSDGDFLVVPQEGRLLVRTELGRIHVQPTEICVIPRGIVFSVHVDDFEQEVRKRGYVLEVFKGHFGLPELGPIGSNGLANPRDFRYPVAWCEDPLVPPVGALLYNKFGSKLWSKPISSTPFDVVAWHGNYLPFKYDLKTFCAVGSVSFDHMDPSIHTVLTCMGDETGAALCDFVIFPPRWMSTDPNTFRPPWFHRNTMTEFMGLIQGKYDAKKGFSPGGASLHSCMTPHGPDSFSYDRAVVDPCDKPTFFDGGLAFMFETSHLLRLTKYALGHECLDQGYGECWRNLPNHYACKTAGGDATPCML